ncbi:unnamed protein product [Amoebophrya sp. A120]|nr:unnamed protein product [Amoebophrya sp. A120]|eukprot:GSA120T00007610001.1
MKMRSTKLLIAVLTWSVAWPALVQRNVLGSFLSSRSSTNAVEGSTRPGRDLISHGNEHQQEQTADNINNHGGRSSTSTLSAEAARNTAAGTNTGEMKTFSFQFLYSPRRFFQIPSLPDTDVRLYFQLSGCSEKGKTTVAEFLDDAKKMAASRLLRIEDDAYNLKHGANRIFFVTPDREEGEQRLLTLLRAALHEGWLLLEERQKVSPSGILRPKGFGEPFAPDGLLAYTVSTNTLSLREEVLAAHFGDLFLLPAGGTSGAKIFSPPPLAEKLEEVGVEVSWDNDNEDEVLLLNSAEEHAEYQLQRDLLTVSPSTVEPIAASVRAFETVFKNLPKPPVDVRTLHKKGLEMQASVAAHMSANLVSCPKSVAITSDEIRHLLFFHVLERLLPRVAVLVGFLGTVRRKQRDLHALLGGGPIHHDEEASLLQQAVSGNHPFQQHEKEKTESEEGEQDEEQSVSVPRWKILNPWASFIGALRAKFHWYDIHIVDTARMFFPRLPPNFVADRSIKFCVDSQLQILRIAKERLSQEVELARKGGWWEDKLEAARIQMGEVQQKEDHSVAEVVAGSLTALEENVEFITASNLSA